MKKVVIGVSGGIAVGKSEFIRELAERIGGTITGFGDYVRHEARVRELDDSSREVLQGLGEQLKRDLGDAQFVQRVLDRAGESGHAIVDGVRHVEVADTISRLVAPDRFILVFLDADQQTRSARAESRSSRPTDAARLDKLAAHSTERQVHDGSLRARADLVLDATRPVVQLVAETITFLGRC